MDFLLFWWSLRFKKAWWTLEVKILMGRQDNSNLVGEEIATFLQEDISSLSLLLWWFTYTVNWTAVGEKPSYLIKPLKQRHSASQLFCNRTSFSFLSMSIHIFLQTRGITYYLLCRFAAYCSGPVLNWWSTYAKLWSVYVVFPFLLWFQLKTPLPRFMTW